MVLKRSVYFLLLVFLFFTVGCVRQQQKPEIASVFDAVPDSALVSKVKYAIGFDLYEKNGVKKLVIWHPEIPDKEIATFYIADSTVLKKYNLSETQSVIAENSNRVAVFSATQLNAFDRLSLLDHVMGITEANYINNKQVKEKLKKGEIIELGANDHYLIEKIMSLHPDYIFYSPYKLTADHPLKVTGIPLIPFFDFHEYTPLGRAEWIKFTAAFFGDDVKADSIFKKIEQQYKYYKSLTDNLTSRPTVFSDKYFNGQWYVPGGKSYIAALFRDAGADYLWKDDSHTGSIPLDYEVVFSKAHDADFWRIVGSYGDVPSYEALMEENSLYANFKAFKTKHVIWCDAQKTAYFEKSSLEPQLVLADLIYAFHPKLLPAYKPKYYEILK
jgi:iron complex transport system substrate-binding protein